MKKFIKSIALFLSFAICLICVSACGTSTDTKSDSSKSASDASLLSGWDYIKSNKKLIVGLDDTFAPMGYRDENGKLVGFDIDIANEVGKILDVEISFQTIDWNAKELALSSKRVDCIWNGMSVLPERIEKMALTDKYLQNKIVIALSSDKIIIKSAADLKNYNIGTQVDSAALEKMVINPEYNSFKDKIKEYPTYDEALMDLKAGRVDCIVIDDVLMAFKNKNLGEGKMLPYAEFDFGDDYYAIGCRKSDTDVAAKINSALKTLIDNGKGAEISKKWFGKNIFVLVGYDK
ncbi:MAG: amino acid ABC transporter substrate-binding protein [Clostridia bacterium]